MKQYYCFIREPYRFTTDSVVYTVSVGSSQRERAKLELVRLWCLDAGAYFKMRSDDVQTTIDNLAETMFPSIDFPRLLLRRKYVTISELYRLIVDWSWSEIESDYSVTPAFLHQFKNTSMASLFIKTSKGAKTVCQTVTRKYLSDEVDNSPLFAAVNFGLIVALFLFTSWIDSLMF